MLERGEVANSWRHERWDSLRLLTPNWQSRLPGHRYDGPDPDGYMTMGEVIEFIERFAAARARPVRTGADVTSVRRTDDGYRRDDEPRRAPLPGGGDRERRLQPARRCRRSATRCRRRVEQLTPFDYRDPDAARPTAACSSWARRRPACSWPPSCRRSGRPVTLSVGEHVRLPRTYRGRDVLWWMDASGVWDQRYDEVDDLTRARRLPSPQLVGTPERTTLDLNALTDAGGRAGGPLGGRPRRPRPVLRRPAQRVLARGPQAWSGCWTRSTSGPGRTGATPRSDPPERFAPTRVPDVDAACSSTWAAARSARSCGRPGYRPDYGWLDVPVVDAKGQLRHDGGVVDSPGLYALGLPVLRRRKSTFIHGIEDDAREVVDHLAAYLAGRRLDA